MTPIINTVGMITVRNRTVLLYFPLIFPKRHGRKAES